MRGTSPAKVRPSHTSWRSASKPLKTAIFWGPVLRRRLFRASVVALVGACGLVVATLADAGCGYLGVAVVSEELGGKSSERGAAVQTIAPNSPARLAGLMAGDLVVAADYTRIRSAEELQRYISSKHPNETVALVVIRDKRTGVTTSKVSVTLTGAPAATSSAPASSSPESQGASSTSASAPAAPEFF